MTYTRPDLEVGPSSAEPGGTAGPADPPAPRPDWVVVRRAGDPVAVDRVPRVRTVLLQIAAAAVVVIAAVAVVGLLVSRRAAESESVRDSAELTNVIAETVVQPALTDDMATSTTAAARLAPLLRRVLTQNSLVRIKIWSPDGRILYSDEPRLVGQRFGLAADAREALTDPQVSAEISDLREDENRYERGRGTLLEVHRPVYTPNGRPLLFETYFRYDQVTERSGELWRAFATITLGSIGVLVALLVPLTWTLLLRARRAQRQREQMMQRAVAASEEERRRIAATLHDGVVQDLVAASFAVAAGAKDAQSRGAPQLAEQLRDAGDTVRSGIGAMRALLVDIYPPNLHEAGLSVALRDLAAGLHLDVDTAIDEDAALALDEEQTEAVFRVAQETLRNVAAHARAATASLTLHLESGSTGAAAVLEVGDDGVGFDPAARPEGHFGRSLLDDVARATGAELALRTAPGAGTTWRLRLPVREAR